MKGKRRTRPEPVAAGPLGTAAAVEWRVLYDLDPNPQGDEISDSEATFAVSDRASVGQWLLLLCLAVLVGGYTLREMQDNGSRPAPVLPLPPARQSADALALAAHDAVLTEHLRIYAEGLDLSVTALQAGEMERLYSDIFERLGLPAGADVRAPDGRFLVSVHGATRIQWDASTGLIALPSPTQRTPVAFMGQADFLRQSWLIALGQQSVAEVVEAYSVPYGWMPLLSGLRLWLLWDGDGPLNLGRQRIVAWLSDPSTRGLIIEEVADICRVFSFWRLSPLDYGIPVGCDQSGYVLPSAVPLPKELTTIAPINPPKDSLDDQFTPYLPRTSKATAVAGALFFDYSTQMYGQDSLPRLLSGLAVHHNWDTLIPAVYGVPVESFEADWQHWIAQEYKTHP